MFDYRMTKVWSLMAVVVTLASTAPSAPASSPSITSSANNAPAAPTLQKREVENSEMDAIFADGDVQKRSREGIMFGNQQNKPTSMVDDALSAGLVEKKDTKMDTDDAASGDASNGTSDSEIPMPAAEGTNAGETQTLEKDDEEEGGSNRGDEMSPELDEPDDEDSEIDHTNFNGFDQLPSSAAAGRARMDDSTLELPKDWNEIPDQYYGGGSGVPSRRRKRRNIVRTEHNSRKRSLRTPLEELLKFRESSRMKRDLHFDDEDVVGLLNLLAAAEVARERNEARGYYDLSPYNTNLQDVDDDDNNFDVQDLNDDNDDEDDEINVSWPYMMPAPELELRRRSLYPARFDYRAMGVPGERRKRVDSFALLRQPGLWGRLEERRRRLLSTDDDDDDDDADVTYMTDDDDDDEDDGNNVYALSELLGRENEVPEGRYKRHL